MDKKEALKIVQNCIDGYELENLPAHFKKDKEIVLEAVRQNGCTLEHADDSLKKDKKIVLEAVKQYGGALQYADGSLKNDPDILAIVNKDK